MGNLNVSISASPKITKYKLSAPSHRMQSKNNKERFVSCIHFLNKGNINTSKMVVSDGVRFVFTISSYTNSTPSTII